MRAFFKEILLNLYIYCGNRQADKMTVEEVDALLTALERVSKIYNYIPEDKQKEIILTCLVSDRDYQNINVRTVSKWFEQNGKTYFKEVAHKPTEPTAEPLTGEAREKAIQEFLNAIAKAETNFTTAMVKGNGAKMRENLDEHGVKFDETKHKKYDPNDTSDLQEMLAEHEALNKQGSEGAIENTGLPEDNADTPQSNENFSQQRENI